MKFKNCLSELLVNYDNLRALRVLRGEFSFLRRTKANTAGPPADERIRSYDAIIQRGP